MQTDLPSLSMLFKGTFGYHGARICRRRTLCWLSCVVTFSLMAPNLPGWRGRVFVTQAIEAGSRRTLMYFDRRDGKLLWQSGVTWTEKEETYPDNPPCTPSPVSDGKRVIAWFGSAGVHCYDFKGLELWHCDL